MANLQHSVVGIGIYFVFFGLGSIPCPIEVWHGGIINVTLWFSMVLVYFRFLIALGD